MKKWLIVLIPLLILGGLIVWRLDQNKLKALEEGGPAMGGRAMGRGGPASVELASPQFRDILKTFQATGSVESMQNVKISSKISGRIDYLQVREGDRVTQGQVLVRLDQSELQAQVRQQQANLAEAKYRLAQAQLNQLPTDTAVASQVEQQSANVHSAEAELRQARRTREAQLEAITASLDEAQSRIDSAEASVASANADLQQAQQTHEAQFESVNASLDDAQSKIENATAAVANANAVVKSAQANLENATTKYTRIYGLYKQGFITAQDVDDAKTTVSVQQSSVDTAKGQLQAATASLNSAKAQKRSVEQQGHITRAKADADLEAARAKVTQAKAALASARAQKRSAEQQANITRAKADADIESAQAKVTQANASLASARANTKQSPAYRQNLEALTASVAVAQASLDSARVRLDDAVLRSPLDGVVTARSQDPGGLASPGQALVTVQSLNGIWVTISVPEDVCRKIHLSQEATVAFDALNGRAFTGRIAQINPSADPASRQFTVRVALPNREHLFTPGMFARVTLVTERASRTLAVPREAVQQDEVGNSYVFAVGADQIAHQRPITVSVSDADWTGIVAGLDVKEKVVTMSAMPVRDGQMVRAGGGRRHGGPGGRGAGQRPGRSEAGGASPSAPQGAGTSRRDTRGRE